MNNDLKPSDSWPPCPEGALDTMVRRIQSKRRAKTIRTVAGPLLVLLVLGGTAGYLLQSSSPPSYGAMGNLTCEEAQTLLPQQQAGDLDREMAERLAVHLLECPHCSPLEYPLAPMRDPVSNAENPVASTPTEFYSEVGRNKLFSAVPACWATTPHCRNCAKKLVPAYISFPATEKPVLSPDARNDRVLQCWTRSGKV